MTLLVPRAPQIPMIDWVTSHERCGLWAGMGIGKTSGILVALDSLALTDQIDRSEPTLVIGPMRVARDTWPDEAAKWDNLRHFNIVPLTGSPEARRAKLKTKADIFTVSYELAPWLVEQFEERWPFRTVIADESDRLKGLRGKKGGADKGTKRAASGLRAFQLARVARNLVRRWINLTGTPAPAGYADLWGQTWYLDFGHRLGATHGAFMQRWFRQNEYTRRITLMPHAKAEIDRLLSDICLTVDPKDYFDLKEPNVVPVRVKLPEKARAIYKDMENEMFAQLESGEEISVMNAIALTAKLLQLANGAIYTNNPQWAPVHDAKLDALESIVHEAGGMPLLVQYNFVSDAARIKHRFPKAVELRTKEGMKAFTAGDSPMGIAHPKSMGHGIDGLQHVTCKLVRFGHDWKTGERLQMLERIGPMRQFQAGYERLVDVYDIVAEGTMDETVISAHEHNIGVQDALLAAMKRRH